MLVIRSKPEFTWESIPAGERFTSTTFEGLTEFLDMRAEIERLRRIEEAARVVYEGWLAGNFDWDPLAEALATEPSDA